MDGGGALPSPPETRARSRSKTPFTKASEENGKDNRKSPDLLVITEDLETSASSTPIKSSKRQASQKVVQSATTTTTTVIQTTSSTSSSGTVTKSRKSTATAAASSSNGSSEVSPAAGAAKKGNVSKEMKELENKRTKEIKQNEVNERIVKKSVTSTPKMSPSSSSNASFKLNSSHEDLDLDKHPAYSSLESGCLRVQP